MWRLVAVTVQAAALSMSLEVVAQDPDVSDVVAALSEMESTLQRAAVTLRIEAEKSAPQDRARMMQFKRTLKIIFEFHGRLRLESSGDDVRIVGDEEQRYPVVEEMAFDGTTVRRQEGNDKPAFGWIQADRGLMPLIVDPREITTHFNGKSVSAWISEGAAQFVERKTAHGVEVWVVETEVVEAEQNWKSRFYVAPDLGFAVVRRSQLIQFVPYDWIEFQTIENSEYSEVESGVWLPGRTVVENTDPNESHARARTAPPLAWRYVAANSEWMVNPAIDDDIFHLKFADGVLVEDKIAGSALQQPNVTESVLEQQAGDAKRGDSSGGGWNLFSRVLVANAVVIGLAGLFAVWRLRNRKAEYPEIQKNHRT